MTEYVQTCEAILLPSISTVIVATPVEVSPTRPTFSESESMVHTDLSLELPMVEKHTKTTYFCVTFSSDIFRLVDNHLYHSLLFEINQMHYQYQ